MNIKSDSKEINKSADLIFEFLTDFRNFEKLMPEQIANWQADADSCSFEIKGMATIQLRMIEKKAPEYLKIVAEGKTPFPFSLMTHLEKKSSTLSKSIFEIDRSYGGV